MKAEIEAIAEENKKRDESGSKMLAKLLDKVEGLKAELAEPEYDEEFHKTIGAFRY